MIHFTALKYGVLDLTEGVIQNYNESNKTHVKQVYVTIHKPWLCHPAKHVDVLIELNVFFFSRVAKLEGHLQERRTLVFSLLSFI